MDYFIICIHNSLDRVLYFKKVIFLEALGHSLSIAEISTFNAIRFVHTITLELHADK